MAKQQENKFYRQYDLVQARKYPSSRVPENHQNKALKNLRNWFESKPHPYAGGILALPTGGGKTYTAVRFLCKNPISEGYKILWLAHTHHLLEQAFYSFGPKNITEASHTGYEVGWITEPKQQLNTRVVSGTKGHFRVQHINPSDDVVICTIQTAAKAYKKQQAQFMAFLEAAGDKLLIAFDEAHHSPAPSYRKLILDLRKNHRRMYLLGLTATPTYTDDRKRGWLLKLFPQWIIEQTPPQELIATRILAEPRFEEFSTNFTPEFDDREYQEWLGTYQPDIPEVVITKLAESRDRNRVIADTYSKNKEHYGKTIIFADRKPQCIQLQEFLEARNVRAGAIFSIDVGEDKNAQTLGAFRNNELDVLINIRMLTEGTDIPSTQTVFLTRQTTSRILLTQMIGRALRGPKFGGTETANIVSFIDDWRHLIHWAEYDRPDGGVDDPEVESAKRPPLHLISIDLVRRLVRQMDNRVIFSPVPFLKLMPIGWYRVEFVTLVEEGSDALDTMRRLTMVFDNEKNSYERFIQHLKETKIEEFASEDIRFIDQQKQINKWYERFFFEVETLLKDDLLTNLFYIVRHMAQNDGNPPTFFQFAKRENHDLDTLAQQFIEEQLDRLTENQRIQEEYNKEDRYWKTFYPNSDLFKYQYNLCVERILKKGPKKPPDGVIDEESPPDDIPPETKQQVKNRDGYFCLCCGETNKAQLQVDHIKARYHDGSDSLDNLQTLCNTCNGTKGDKTINFQEHRTSLTAPPSTFPSFKLPQGIKAYDNKEWEKYLRRSINFFYQRAAVESATLKESGQFYNWQINLYEGNDPTWLKHHLKGLLVNYAHRVQVVAGTQGEQVTRAKSPPTSKPPNKTSITKKKGLTFVPDGTLCRFSYKSKQFEGKISNGIIVIHRKGRFKTFSAASSSRTGTKRNGWKDWELQLPGTKKWTLADNWWEKNVKSGRV